MDEVRVWDTARSAADIRSSIHSEITAAPDLVARWGMSEGGGSVVGDSVAPLADGTIVGSNYSWVAGAPFDLPTVNAGPDTTVILYAGGLLDGMALDDGSPAVAHNNVDPGSGTSRG